MSPTLSPQEFVAKWRKTTLKERSAAQEHFITGTHNCRGGQNRRRVMRESLGGSGWQSGHR